MMSCDPLLCYMARLMLRWGHSQSEPLLITRAPLKAEGFLWLLTKEKVRESEVWGDLTCLLAERWRGPL